MSNKFALPTLLMLSIFCAPSQSFAETDWVELVEGKRELIEYGDVPALKKLLKLAKKKTPGIATQLAEEIVSLDPLDSQAQKILGRELFLGVWMFEQEVEILKEDLKSEKANKKIRKVAKQLNSEDNQFTKMAYIDQLNMLAPALAFESWYSMITDNQTTSKVLGKIAPLYQNYVSGRPCTAWVDSLKIGGANRVYVSWKFIESSMVASDHNTALKVLCKAVSRSNNPDYTQNGMGILLRFDCPLVRKTARALLKRTVNQNVKTKLIPIVGQWDLEDMHNE